MRRRPRFVVGDGFFRREPDGALRAASLEFRMIGPDDDEYPVALAVRDDAPEHLWVAGRSLRSYGSKVTVIGARRANRYGLTQAHRLAADLAVGGVCVVSGMARGCDAAAHDGALEAGGATIAVLGSGVDICYPAGSSVLYAEIAARGSIVSMSPPGHRALRHDFLARNRLMVAMSVAVVVVQGAEDSAAVKTGLAAADGGEVFAVPGSIEWPESAGVHRLLREGAGVCASAGDLKHVLQDRLRWTPPDSRPVPEHLPEAHRRLLDIVSNGAATRDGIVARSGLATVEAMRALADLELAGFVTEEGFFLTRSR